MKLFIRTSLAVSLMLSIVPGMNAAEKRAYLQLTLPETATKIACEDGEVSYEYTRFPRLKPFLKPFWTPTYTAPGTMNQRGAICFQSPARLNWRKSFNVTQTGKYILVGLAGLTVFLLNDYAVYKFGQWRATKAA